MLSVLHYLMLYILLQTFSLNTNQKEILVKVFKVVLRHLHI